MAGGDGRLQPIRAETPPEPLGPLQGGQPALNQDPIPPPPVLGEQEDRLSGTPHARPQP